MAAPNSREYRDYLFSQYEKKFGPVGQTSYGAGPVKVSNLLGQQQALQTGNPLATPGDFSLGTSTAGKGDMNGLSGFRKFIDVIEQPMYSAVQSAAEFTDTAKQEGLGSALKEFAKGGGALGATVRNMGERNNKNTASDLLRSGREFNLDNGRTVKTTGTILDANENDHLGNKTAKFVGGLVMDIGLDPVTYIPGALLTKPIGAVGKLGVKGLSKVPGANKHIIDPIAEFGSRITKKGAATKSAMVTKKGAPQTEYQLSNLVSGLIAKGVDVPEEVLTLANKINTGVDLSKAGKAAAATSSKIDKGTFVPTKMAVPKTTEIVENGSKAVDDIMQNAPVEEISTKLDEVLGEVTEKKRMLKAVGVKGAQEVEYSEELASLRKIKKEAEGLEKLYPALEGETLESLGLVNKVARPNPHTSLVKQAEKELVEVSALENSKILAADSTAFTALPKIMPNNVHPQLAAALFDALFSDTTKIMSGKITRDSIARMIMAPKTLPKASLKEKQALISMAQRRLNSIKGGDLAESLAKSKTTSEAINKAERKVANAKSLFDKHEAKPLMDTVLPKQEELETVAKLLTEKFGVHPVHVTELMRGLRRSANLSYVGSGRATLTKLQKAFTDGSLQYKVLEVALDPNPNRLTEIAVDLGIPSVDEIIERGALIDDTVENFAEKIVKQEPLPEDIAKKLDDSLPAELAEKLKKALGSEDVISKQWDGINPALKYETETGAKASSPKLGEGSHVYTDEATRHIQGNFTKNIMLEMLNDPYVMSKVSGTPFKQGMNTFDVKSGAGLDVLIDANRRVETLFLSKGVHLSSGSGKEGIHLPMSEVLNALKKTAMRSKTTNKAFFSVPTESNIALDPIILSGFADEIINSLLNSKVLGEAIPTKITGKTALEMAKTVPDSVKALMKEKAGVALKAQMDSVKKFTYSSDAVAAQFDNIIEEVTSNTFVGHLIYGFNNYAAKNAIALNAKVSAISEPTIKALLDEVNMLSTNARAYGELLNDTTKGKIAGYLNKSVKGNTPVGDALFETKHLADPTVMKGVEDAITETVEEIYSESIVQQAKYLVEISEQVSKGGSRSALDKIQKSYDDAVGKAFHDEVLSVVHDPGLNTMIAMDTGIGKALDWFGDKFINHYGNATVHQAMLKGGNVGRVFQGIMNKQITQFTKHGSSKDIKLVFSAMQKGTVGSLPEHLQPLIGSMDEVVNTFFRVTDNLDASASGILQSEFMSKGFDINHVIDKMSRGNTKLPESMRFNMSQAKDTAKQLAKAEGREFTDGDVIQALSQQWKNWAVDDPQDFLSRMTSVMGGLATDQAISLEAFRIAKSGNWVSQIPQKGWRPMSGNGVIARYMPEGSYFDPDIARELERMEELLSRTALSNKFVEQYFAPIIDKWKAGMTIYNPNHHVRNLIGDMGMSFLVDGVKNPKYYQRAMRMLAPGNNIRGAYDGFDMLAAMRGMESKPFSSTGKLAARVKINGKTVDLTDEAVQKAAYERGILPDFNTTEDLNRKGDTVKEVINSKGEKVTTEISQSFRENLDSVKPLGGRVREFAGSATEARDDMVRLDHFMHILENPPKHIKGMDELMDYAAQRVRKSHPDGADLTAFERAHMRKIFPFYSWTRKAIPLVIESALTKPGRHLVYPKAMYNLAQANGIEPESLSEPFPEHMMFPDWLTEKATGPTMHFGSDMTSLDIGMPDVDLANDFLAGGPKGLATGVVGMMNPLIKGPIELATGSKLATQMPVQDVGEYLDYSIPGTSQVASTGGVSIFGTLGNLLTGKLELDPTRSVEKGNRTGWSEGKQDPHALVNRLFGARATNWETPSTVKGAQISLRNKMKDN